MTAACCPPAEIALSYRATDGVDLSHYVHTADDGTCHIDLAADGIHCAACIGAIERGLSTVPGVTGVRVNFTLRRVGIDWQKGEVDATTLLDRLAALGYPARPYHMHAAEADAAREMKRLIRSMAVAGFAAMNIMLLSVSVWSGNASDITPATRDFFHWFSALIALPAVAYAGMPFFQSAWRALKARRINMDVPISLGVLMAVGVSLYETATAARDVYFDSAVMLLFFLLAGRALDLAVRRKTRAFAGNLAALKAETAERLSTDGTTRTVPAAAIEVGDTILIRPGDRVAADGRVIAGASAVDQSLVTGETLPKTVALGDTVYAGSLNQGGTLTVAVTAPDGNALVDTVQKLLDKAVEARSQRLRLADRAAELYAPVVHLTALFAAIGWFVAGAGIHQAVLVATAVLIITCPCAIALAIPAVQVAASGALFRKGVFLNAGDAIERLAEVDTVVFDKTGTLTLPEPGVANAGEIPADLMDMAARLARSSRHPLAVALAGRARDAAPFGDAVEAPGQGVSATIDGIAAKLGSPAYCGVTAVARSGGVAPRLPAWRCDRDHPAPPAAPPGRCRNHRRAPPPRPRLRDPFRRHTGGRGAGRRRARHRNGRGRTDAGGQDRPPGGACRGGPPGRLRRRRAERRALARGGTCLAVAGLRGRPRPGKRGRGLPRREAVAGGRGLRCRGQGAAADDREPVVRGDLQSRRGAARRLRAGDPADRGPGDVRLVDRGDDERAEGAAARAERAGCRDATRPGRAGMTVLVYLIPGALLLGLVWLGMFLWSLNNGQYEDLDGAALRVLDDSDIDPPDGAPARRGAAGAGAARKTRARRAADRRSADRSRSLDTRHRER